MFKIEDFRFTSSSIDDFYSPPVAKHHVASAARVRIASASDLKGFVRVASNKLVHISQQDFWKLAKDSETGEYYLERLADDSEGPIKG